MENSDETGRLSQLIVAAMRVSTDLVTAVSAENVAALGLAEAAQLTHLARCVAAFTTDDSLAAELTELVGESPQFLASKVLLLRYAPEQCTGENADLEKRIWKSLYAGRRELIRVRQTLTRRGAL